MVEGNQEPPRSLHSTNDPPSPPPTLDDTVLPAWAAPSDPPGPPSAVGSSAPAGEQGLFRWLLLVLASALASLAFSMPELGVLAAFAGIAAISHSADLDLRWRMLQWISTAIVSIIFAAAFATITGALWSSDLVEPQRVIAVVVSAAAALGSLLLGLPLLAGRFARALFGGDSHTLRMAARLVFAGAMFCFPGWALFHGSGGIFSFDPEQFDVRTASLTGTLVGMTLLAFAAVGFLVRRDLGAACRRLGLEPLRPSQLGWVAIGLVAMFALNIGLEWVQREFFPAAWESDQRFNEMLAGTLSTTGIVVLALSAGIGEELTLRGALQPRLGLVLTAMLFAALHVQYSWIGMLGIVMLGLMLGVIRQRSTTTVAIVVHTLYDLVAVLSIGVES